MLQRTWITNLSHLLLPGAVYISTFAVGYLPKPSNPPADQAEFVAATIQPIVAFIVLCSVAIHGLSIPFFSLGRRVHSVSSRTWSRHASGPDWATHTRHITRGEDVVINRDHDANAMENGRAGLAEEEKTIMESRRTSADLKALQEDGTSKTEDMLNGDETANEQTAPDRAEIVMEWKEGSDKIIERRAGPGEEVSLGGSRTMCVLMVHARLTYKSSVTHIDGRVLLLPRMALCGKPDLTSNIIFATLPRVLRRVWNRSDLGIALKPMSPLLEPSRKRSPSPLDYRRKKPPL